MVIIFEDTSMTLEIDGSVIATATHVGGGEWVVDTWPRYFSRSQAITAMVLAERLALGYRDDDVFVIGWREEMGCG